MMNSFALRNIINLTQGSGTALHPGRIPDGPGFPIFLAVEQLAAEQASIPSETFLPDSDGDILKALGNGRSIDLTKVTIAPVEKGAEMAYNKKTPYSIPNVRIQHPVSSNQAIKHRASSIKSQVSSLRSPVTGLLSQVSYLMSCVYPLANKVVKGDIILSQATEDAHRLDVSPMNADADIRALRHTSYVMHHRHGVTQPSVVRIASQPETIERIVQISPPDQVFLQFEQTTDYGSSPMNAGADIRALRHTSYVIRHRHDVTQPSVVRIASQPETIERVLQASPPGQAFLRVKPTTDHGSPITDHGLRITDYGSRTHDVVYTNAREILPSSSVLRPGVIPGGITESPHAVVLSKAPAEKQIFYANPKSDTPDLWVKVAGNIAERNPGDVITSVKHGPGYIEEGSEVSVQAKGTSEVYRQPETEHAPRADASQLKPSIQVQRVVYVPNSNGKLEQQEISEIGEKPTASKSIHSQSGPLADEVIKTPVREDNHGSSEPQLRIEAHVFREQGSPKLSLQGNGVRFNTIPSSTFEGASVAEKVQASQQQERISQTPSEYVRVEGNIQEIQTELAGEKNLDRIHQPLRQEINPQDIQGYVKHPQLNVEVRSEMQYAAASLDAFEGTSLAEKVQESQLQEIIPKIPQEPVRIEGNVQEIQPELVVKEKVDRIHQPLRQEITSQDVQDYGKHPQINADVRSEMRYGTAPLNTFEGASVAEKVQELHSQEIIPQTSREYVRIEGNIQEIQPELVAEEKADRIHQPLPQEIRPQNAQEYGKHIEPNDNAKIEMRYGSSPLNTFERSSVAEKVQESHSQQIQPELVAEEKVDRIHQPLPQEIRPQNAQEYGEHPESNDDAKIEMRYGSSPLNTFEGASLAEKVQESQPQEVILQAVKEIQPEPVAEEKADRLHQPLRQEIRPQEVQEYGKHLELNDEIKIETRRGVASPDAFEVGSVAGKVQKSQPQEVILQAVQESVRAKDEVQEIQPELSRNQETGRIQQLVQQEVGSQNVQDYGKNPEFRVESQPYGKEIQATASMPELQDKIPFYVSKMVAGERSEAIWIQLEPEHLGKVKLRILLSDNKISVNLSVNRPETRGIIELQVPDIRRSLARHEINITEFRVSLENGFSNSNPRYSNLFHDNANTNSRPAYERRDWNRDQSEHSNRQRYYRSDSLVDLLV